MATKLLNSFHAVYVLLERPRAARRTVVALLIVHTLLLGYSAYVHSPTLNEPGHLVAGLSYWKFGRFDVYNVNPPLVKMVAALPVMAVGYQEDWSGFYQGPGARPEMAMGEDFVAANGERSFFLFMIARWGCIPFSWLGAIVCYLWARDLYGRPSGVFAAVIWCFEPNILAHASLITSDAAPTALGLAACYTFWRWLRNPTWIQAALTGVVLGLAELAKTALIVLYPLWPLMWLVYRWSDRSRLALRDWLREAGMLALRMLIGLYVLNLGYGFEGSFTPLKNFHFVSNLFTGSDRFASDTRYPTPDTSPPNRFANTWLHEMPVPFPKNYLLGIDIQQRDFEHYGRPSYLRGEWRERGWWYYYLYACAIKVPLGLWLLGLVILIARILFGFLRHSRREMASGNTELPFNNWTINLQQPTLGPRDEFILLFPAVVIFTVVSSKTGFSEHMRYVLPTFPYFFISVSQCSKVFSPVFGHREAGFLNFAEEGIHCEKLRPNWRLRSVPLFSASLVSILASWLIVSSLWVYPHSLSYFNESIGGPLNGPKHLLGSNVDWGQDLRYLHRRTSKLSGSHTKYLAYFGWHSPSLIWIAFPPAQHVRLSPQSSSGTELDSFAKAETELVAISVSLLQGERSVSIDYIADQFSRSHQTVDYSASTRPIAMAGYSTAIFKLKDGAH